MLSCFSEYIAQNVSQYSSLYLSLTVLTNTENSDEQ